MTPDEIKAAATGAEEQIVAQSKRIEFYVTEYSIELLAQKMLNKDFEIPAYQRADTWEPARKSRFIESLLMGLPIPFLFFWEKPSSGQLEIVDGSQRLRTIKQFIYDHLVLGALEKLTELEGLRFQDLPESRQRKIKNRSIRGIVLNEHADEEARFDLFDRINTSSKIANNAEVRRGSLLGPFLNLVIELADDPTFVDLAPTPEAQTRLRGREELVTRFFAYSDGLDGYHDRPSLFLFQYARKMNASVHRAPRRGRSLPTPIRKHDGVHRASVSLSDFAERHVGKLRHERALRQLPLGVTWRFRNEASCATRTSM